jgi:dynein heavy chain
MVISPSESGRYTTTWRPGNKSLQVYSTTGKDSLTPEQGVAVYRVSMKKPIDGKNIAEYLYFHKVGADPSKYKPFRFFVRILEDIHIPSTEHSTEFENEAKKAHFVYILEYSASFLRCIDQVYKYRVNFEVNHDLYKGFLLAPHQIEETAGHPERMLQVEREFLGWIRLIYEADNQGDILRKDTATGPNTEIEFWVLMIAKYGSVIQFYESKPFRNYLECLTLSRSKVVPVRWAFYADFRLILFKDTFSNGAQLKAELCTDSAWPRRLSIFWGRCPSSGFACTSKCPCVPNISSSNSPSLSLSQG